MLCRPPDPTLKPSQVNNLKILILLSGAAEDFSGIVNLLKKYRMFVLTTNWTMHFKVLRSRNYADFYANKV
jgi:hypothetical protein